MKWLIYRCFFVWYWIVNDHKRKIKWGLALLAIVPIATACNGRKSNLDSNVQNDTIPDSVAVTCYEPVLNKSESQDSISIPSQ